MQISSMILSLALAAGAGSVTAQASDLTGYYRGQLALEILTLNAVTEKDALNAYLRDCALSPEFQEQIDYSSSTEIVSSDLVGSRHAGVVDAPATIANGRNIVLYVWYDNEFGYSCQVVRLAQQMAGIHFAALPA